MIAFIIKNPRVVHDDPRYANKVVVLHPDNDAILAVCDTRKEASGVVDDLTCMADLLAEDEPEAS